MHIRLRRLGLWWLYSIKLNRFFYSLGLTSIVTYRYRRNN